MSLLSGGERSLAALAFLFAVFRSRPSPFYLMDEVEAALDDVNLHRFLGLIDEFRDEAQLVIVSHQKRTMEAADALYGVTMAPGGSSQVVSQKVERDRGACVSHVIVWLIVAVAVVRPRDRDRRARPGPPRTRLELGPTAARRPRRPRQPPRRAAPVAPPRHAGERGRPPAGPAVPEAVAPAALSARARPRPARSSTACAPCAAAPTVGADELAEVE